MKYLSVVLCFLALVTSYAGGLMAQEQPSNPAVQVRYNYYSVQGVTANALRSHMSHHGPISQVEGQHYDANTDWRVSWSYHYTHTTNHCAIDRVSGRVEVTITLPQWTTYHTAPRSLVVNWNRYMDALQNHENGHKENGIAAGEAVLQSLRTMPAYANCQDLVSAVNTTTAQVVRHYNQWDLDYDRITQHGATQGATFP